MRVQMLSVRWRSKFMKRRNGLEKIKDVELP